MEYIIKPYIGFNEVKLGMNSEEIINITNQTPVKLNKTKDTKAEQYDGFFVYYKNNGESDAIEFFEEENISVKFNDISMFDYTYYELENIFKKLDNELLIDNDGFTSFKFGIGMWIPDKEEESEKPESVIIFEKGYYD